MSSPFAPPAAPGEGIKWKDIGPGSLLLIEPKGVKTNVATSFGTAEKVTQVDVSVIDGPLAGETYMDALVFPKVLSDQLSQSIGQKVLGRLTQGTAKPGQSPPWLLAEPTDADTQQGVQYLTNNGLAQPAPATQATPEAQPVQQAQPAPQQGQTVPF